MDFNNKVEAEAFPVLVTPISSTKTSTSINGLELPLSSWYNKLKGAIMKTINGKLVVCDLRDEDGFQLSNENNFEYAVDSIAQSENLQNQKIEDLKFAVKALDSRLNQSEKKLDALSHQMSRKILTITVIGAIGLTSLGMWIGLSHKTSTATRNSGNYTVTEEIRDR